MCLSAVFRYELGIFYRGVYKVISFECTGASYLYASCHTSGHRVDHKI